MVSSSIKDKDRFFQINVNGTENVLKAMLNEIKNNDVHSDAVALKEWWQQIDEWRSKDCLKYDRDSDIIKPQYVVEELHKATNGDAFITSDVGQHQMFDAQYYRFNKPRRWINSGGLGTMGFSIPWACNASTIFGMFIVKKPASA